MNLLDLYQINQSSLDQAKTGLLGIDVQNVKQKLRNTVDQVKKRGFSRANNSLRYTMETNSIMNQ